MCNGFLCFTAGSHTVHTLTNMDGDGSISSEWPPNPVCVRVLRVLQTPPKECDTLVGCVEPIEDWLSFFLFSNFLLGQSQELSSSTVEALQLPSLKFRMLFVLEYIVSLFLLAQCYMMQVCSFILPLWILASTWSVVSNWPKPTHC